MKLIFEKSVKGARAFTLPASDLPEEKLAEEIPEEHLREEDPLLPEVSEVEAVRHFTELSRRSYGVDSGFYPLGSCTMSGAEACTDAGNGKRRREGKSQEGIY